MKNLSFKLFIAILAISTTFVSCDKDEDDIAEKKNQFSYDGSKYALTKGNMHFRSTHNNISYMEITLASEGISYSSENDYSGTGDALNFELYSSNELGTGTYSETGGAANTFGDVWVLVDYNIANEIGTEAYIQHGTITVDKSETTYEITIDCTDVNGKEVTGYYKGILNYYDESNKKSLDITKSFF